MITIFLKREYFKLRCILKHYYFPPPPNRPIKTERFEIVLNNLKHLPNIVKYTK